MMFPHIGRYRDVQKRAEHNQVRYQPKIKLHGTHGAIAIMGGRIIALSRNRSLRPESDNYGFAAWVETQKSRIHPASFARTIFGEWYGEGIQKGVAVSRVPRQFAVYAAYQDDTFISEPWQLRSLIDDLEAHVLPWYGPPVLAGALDIDAIDQEIARIDAECPWGRDVHGVIGPGEGLVYYPLDGHDFATFAWKAKGARHTSTPGVRVLAPLPPHVESFVDVALHPARLEQAVQETGPRVPENIPAFLKWLGRDVERELALELEASRLEWKQVAKQLSRKAAQWYQIGVTKT